MCASEGTHCALENEERDLPVVRGMPTEDLVEGWDAVPALGPEDFHAARRLQEQVEAEHAEARSGYR